MTALQHTVRIPSDTTETPCCGCSAVLLIPADFSDIPLCRACRKSQQESDVIGLCQQIRDLAAGNAPYDLLTVDDRRVHLSQLAVCVEHARKVTLGVKPDGEVCCGLPMQDSLRHGFNVHFYYCTKCGNRREDDSVSPAVRAVAYEHYVSMGEDPSDAEKEAIYAMEAVLDVEETREREQNAGWL